MKVIKSSCPVCMAHIMFESGDDSEIVRCDECLSPLVVGRLTSEGGVYLQVAREEED
ncbi:hypothetical protein HZC27_03650 [Candidatus Roizmanbacteria bacterium]|nr:hypothetical protein [Candidatus Roizmanbacteria bacterium]